MGPSPAELNDRYRAAILGFAVGDALGFPMRGLPPQSLKKVSGLAEDFAPRPRGRFARGQFSDDTQLMLATCESVAAEGKIDGRSLARHYAWLWQEGAILQPPPVLTEAVERVIAGAAWMSAGAPIGRCDPSAISRGLPLGLWHAKSPERLAHDAAVAVVITHKDSRCAAAAAAFGRAVSLGLEGQRHPAAFCEALAQAAAPCDADLAEELRYLPRALGWEVPVALEQLRRVGVPLAELQGVSGLPAHVTPVLLVALYAALRSPGDFRGALGLVLSCGGEVDVAAGICGAVMGASLGTELLPARLRKNVLYADELRETADRLFAASSQARHLVPSPARIPRPRG
jgi:ADP-ribosyl-[dinitrogen reductase] hydrolase